MRRETSCGSWTAQAQRSCPSITTPSAISSTERLSANPAFQPSRSLTGSSIHISPIQYQNVGGFTTKVHSGTDPWATAHEAGHCVGYDCGSIDNEAHHSGGGDYSDNLMSELGGGKVDKCWCKKMEGD